jgi:hypothetical protein
MSSPSNFKVSGLNLRMLIHSELITVQGKDDHQVLVFYMWIPRFPTALIKGTVFFLQQMFLTPLLKAHGCNYMRL